MKKLLTFATTTLMALPLVASADTKCADRDVVVHRLESQYGESIQSMGMAPKFRLVEVFANLETGTWTVLISTAEGPTCMAASGQSFERFDLPPAPQGEDG